MARKLSETMMKTLRIMAAGHEIKLWWDEDRSRAHYDYDPPVSGVSSHIHRNTVYALGWRGLIEVIDLLEDQPEYVVGRFRITEAGRRAEKKENNGNSH